MSLYGPASTRRSPHFFQNASVDSSSSSASTASGSGRCDSPWPSTNATRRPAATSKLATVCMPSPFSSTSAGARSVTMSGPAIARMPFVPSVSCTTHGDHPAVVEAQRGLAAHRDAALPTLDDPHDVAGQVGARRHEVDQRDLAARRREHGLEHRACDRCRRGSRRPRERRRSSRARSASGRGRRRRAARRSMQRSRSAACTASRCCRRVRRAQPYGSRRSARSLRSDGTSQQSRSGGHPRRRPRGKTEGWASDQTDRRGAAEFAAVVNRRSRRSTGSR